jgi:nicotinamide-nucleotide amidase
VTVGEESGRLAGELIGELAARGTTVAVAESLTGGRLVAALTSVPGSSAVVRGAVVAYSSDIKVQLLGVDPHVLAAQGPVCVEVSAQMAQGVRSRLGATYAMSTTGEAGPESASGQPVGTVHVAVSGPSGTTTSQLDLLPGGREDIQSAAVEGALRLLAGILALEKVGSQLGPDAQVGNIED